jgi:HSP20 family protein
MLTGWMDFDDTLRTFDRLQRHLDRALGSYADPRWVRVRPRRVSELAWPPLNLFETKEAFVVKAEVPGVAEGDVSVSVEEEKLVVRGERKADVPEGYRVHQRERAPVAFVRKLPLPARIEANAVSATLADGVLTITLPKAKETLPRQIAVKAL